MIGNAITTYETREIASGLGSWLVFFSDSTESSITPLSNVYEENGTNPSLELSIPTGTYNLTFKNNSSSAINIIPSIQFIG